MNTFFLSNPKYALGFYLVLVLAVPLQAQVWQSATSGVSSTLRAVHFPTPLDGWVAGDNGTVLRSTDGGASWTSQTANVGASGKVLYGTYFLDNTTGWVVGGRGTIRKTTTGGTTAWSAQDATTYTDLYDVSFSNATNGVVVGACGLILHTTNAGAQWTQVSSGEAYNITKVRLLSNGLGIAATSGALLLRTSNGGATWDTVNTGTASNFRGLDLLADGTAYAVTMTGTVLRSADYGAHWTPTSALPVGGNWQALSLIGGGEVWAGGFTNDVYRTSSQGSSAWQQTNTYIFNIDVYGIQFRDSLRGWAVGTNGKIYRTCLRALFTYTVDGKTITLTNTSSGATSYLWTFGDGQTSTNTNPVHTYSAGNTYTVKLKATGPCGTDSVSLVINTSPDAGFNATTTNGCAPAQIQFVNTSSSNVDSVVWFFPGGIPASTISVNPGPVSYPEPGTYDVILIAKNKTGADTLTKTAYITVDSLPTAGFTISFNFQTITLTNTSVNATSYIWDFGDGQSSTLVNPTHTYTANGPYQVILTAKNNCDSAVFVDYIVIDGRPQSDFTASGSSGCAPLSVQFADQSGGAPVSYQWIFPGGTPASSTAISPLVTYAAPGAYDVTLITTNAFGKDTITKTGIIQVSTVTAAAGPVTPVCPGATISLNASGGDIYAWAGPSAFSSGQQNPQRTNAASNMAGVYTVTVTDSGTGCSATATVNVAVSAPVNAGITAASGLELNCTFINLPLTATGGGTYIWSTGLGMGASVNVNAPGIYSVQVTDTGTGCTATASVSVTQDFNIPAVSASGGSLNCNQTSLNLSGNSNISNSTFAWTGPNNFTSNLANPAVNQPGPYHLVVQGPNGCTASADAIVDGHPGSPDAIATGVTLTCNSPTGQLSGSSGFTGLSYAWTGPGGFSSMAQSPAVTAPGTYTLTVQDQFGCTGTATATVIGNQLPPAVSATGGTLKCPASTTIQLSAATNAASPQYAWAGPGGFTSGQAAPSVSLAGNYTVTVTDGQTGCSATATTLVSNPPPVTATITPIGGTVLDCLKDTVFLQASGGNQYHWSPPLGDTAQATVTAGGVYTVTVTDTTTGCSSTSSVQVTKNIQPPSVAVSGGTLSCAIIQVTLKCNTLPTGATYKWTGPGGFISTKQNPDVILSGIYIVTVTGNNGCTVSGTATVADSTSLPNISAAGDTIFCGNAAALHGGSTTPGVLPHWSGPGGFSADVFDTLAVAAGWYYFSVQNPVNGCLSTRPVLVPEVQGPKPKLIAPPKFCPGSKAPLYTDSEYVKYEWSTGDTTGLIYSKGPGPYSVTVTDNHGCAGQTSTALSTFPAPVAQLAITEASGNAGNDGVICVNSPISATGSGGSFYQFFIDNIPVGPPSQNPLKTLTLQQSGVVSVIVSDINGCVDTTLQGEGAGKQAIRVTVIAPVETTIDRTICTGDTAWIGNQPFTLPGTYIKTLVSSAGCDSTVTLVLRYANHLSTEAQAEICQGEIYWFNGQPLTEPGFYRDTFVSSGGCDSVVLLILQVKAGPFFWLGNDRSRCANGSGFTLGQAVCAGCTYQWSTGAATPQIIVKPDVTTDFALTVTSPNQCTYTDSVRIEVYPGYFKKENKVLCPGDSLYWFGQLITDPGTYDTTLQTVNDCDSTLVLTVDFSKGVAPIAQPDVFYVSDKTSQSILHVTANDLSLPPDWSMEILSTPGKGNATVLNRDSIVFIRNNTTTAGYDSLIYVICDLSLCSDGCDTTSVRLILQSGQLDQLKAVMPNAISPESDDGFEENRYFDPVGALEALGYLIDPAAASLYIFNRWGEIVFQADPYTDMDPNGWDGSSGGRSGLLPMGTYYFRLLFLEEGEEKILDGPIAVIRRNK